MKENQKVYVVTEGEYSDYHIEAVSLDKEWAEAYAKRRGGNVEEYTLEEERRLCTTMYEVIFIGQSIYSVLERKGQEYNCDEKIIGDDEKMIILVIAKDKDHARKIAQDKRAEFLARVYGI